ncbi:UNVERIFIED_CONTAM: hypothetical protein GTU68_064702 [Idotea baltica]|nr:hypothetical protein [Idotea baltica]
MSDKQRVTELWCEERRPRGHLPARHTSGRSNNVSLRQNRSRSFRYFRRFLGRSFGDQDHGW